MDYNNLISAADKARESSYSPYSRLRVGAAILTKAGEVYTGCNVECASFGATICAERTALCKAVSEGEREFAAIAVVSGSGHTPPCGICRQMLAELAPGIRVITANGEDVREYRIEDLLPEAFKL